MYAYLSMPYGTGSEVATATLYIAQAVANEANFYALLRYSRRNAVRMTRPSSLKAW
jgi:hypothetical protein